MMTSNFESSLLKLRVSWSTVEVMVVRSEIVLDILDDLESREELRELPRDESVAKADS